MSGRSKGLSKDQIINWPKSLLIKPSYAEIKPIDVTPRLHVGELIYMKYFMQNNYIWISGKVTKRIGNVRYEINTGDNRRYRRHINQLRKCNPTNDQEKY